jgi:hypothetical protein
MGQPDATRESALLHEEKNVPRISNGSLPLFKTALTLFRGTNLASSISRLAKFDITKT